jgi:multidrug resistance efflux pump
MDNKNQPNNNPSRKRLMLLALFAFLVAGAVALFYVYLAENQIYTENADIEAPTIGLSSVSGGTLQNVLVKAGDKISANENVAQIGNDIVKTKDSGVVISVNDNIGKNFAPNEVVVTMIKPVDLRLVAQVEEDKGLADVKVGQKVSFTVDAYGSQKFTGIVDEVSPTAKSGDIVFNISNTRQEQEFNVKVRYDVSSYPELKNGMSAKVWIYKN